MKHKTSKRYFYAAYHRYGNRVANDVCYIVRFPTIAARDAYVLNERWDGNSYHHEAITRAEAQHLFPNAFRIVEDRDMLEVNDMRDWVQDVPGEEFYTSHYYHC